MTLAAHGWSHRRFARELDINRETVGKYLRLVLSKPAISTAGSTGAPAAEPAISTLGTTAGGLRFGCMVTVCGDETKPLNELLMASVKLPPDPTVAGNVSTRLVAPLKAMPLLYHW